MPPTTPSTHRWRFFRAGGFDQVQLDTGADLMALDQLDQKLWVALACPTTGLAFDAKTLQLIDADKDGRIRSPELIAAVKWAGAVLKDPAALVKGGAALPLAAINDAHPEGKAILSSARTLLANLGKKEAAEVTLEDTADTAKIFAQTAFNGDGIVVEESAEAAPLKAVIKDLITVYGSVADRSGKPGIDQAKVDQFFTDAAAFEAWWKKAEADATVLPLGDATAAAFAAFKAVQAKVDDYFARCQLGAFDARALGALNREEKEYLAMAAKDLTITSAEIAGFPLARVEAGRPLPLSAGVNPAWAGKVAALRDAVVQPLLGAKTELTEADWQTVTGRLAAYEAWAAAKAGAAVEKLGLARIREILATSAKADLTGLIAKDKAEEGNVNAINAVERLIRYHRDLYLLCINFVSFKDLYDGGEPAIFQAGTLYLDQRSCLLCLTVEDPGKHATMAALAGTYLAYCDCTRRGSGQKMTIVAAFTDGDADNLMVGRNGIFYDRKGQDWDATITKIVDNPISVRQAFWSPYKKLVRLIEEQVAKRAAAAESAADAKIAAAATAAANVDKTAKPADPKKVDVGTVAALGVAFGAIGTAFATLAGYLSGLIKLPFWQICIAVAALLLVVSGPSMLIAWLKLRKRNLGPILDGNGWAVNAKAKINVPFGTSLTGVAKLPPNASITAVDKFGERPSAWPKLLAIALALCFVYSFLNDQGYVYRLSGGKMGTDRSQKSSGGFSLDQLIKSQTATTNAPPAGQ